MDAIPYDKRILTAIWRVGGQLGRTIYALLPEHGRGVLIGTMDHAAVAEFIVAMHNLDVELERAG